MCVVYVGRKKIFFFYKTITREIIYEYIHIRVYNLEHNAYKYSVFYSMRGRQNRITIETYFDELKNKKINYK